LTRSPGSVGIVLSDKRGAETRIQDETAFNDLLTEAGYEVEILFSEGDSAKEKKRGVFDYQGDRSSNYLPA